MTSNTLALTDRHVMHEGVCTFHDFLTRFRKVLPCQLIMTRWESVITVDRQGDRAQEKASAQALMDENSFSSLPAVEHGELHGFYLRHKPHGKIEYENAKADHFFPCEDDVISLLRHMRDNSRFAVLLGDQNNPRGLVTYADFSKRPARVILFAIVAEVEYLLARAIDKLYPDDKWLDLLSNMNGVAKRTHKAIAKRKTEADRWDAIMPATTFADIGHLISVVKHLEGIERLLGEDRGLPGRLCELPRLRNRVAHVVKPVIAGPKRIKSVTDQVDLMLQWIDRWETRLASDPREGNGG